MPSHHLLTRSPSPRPAHVKNVLFPTLRAFVAVCALFAALAPVAPAPATAQALGNIVVAAVKAPVVPDGDVAGRPADFNLVLDRSLDPLVEGRTLRRGQTIKITLPEAFQRTEAPVGAPQSGALVKGWPQGGYTTYTVTLEGTHTVVFTATEDIVPQGPASPGIKVLHVRGRAFVNPAPGEYAIGVEAQTGPGGALETGMGTLAIRPRVVPSINPSNALLPQPSNNNWQRVLVGTAAPIPLDFLLFDAGGALMDGVGVASAGPADLARYPRYTGGLLVRDTNGDGRLDPTLDVVVGGIVGAAPMGARGQQAFSPTVEAGRPVLSGQLALPSGEPAHGIMRVLFRAGNQPGNYTPAFELEDGTTTRVTVVAVAGPAQGSVGLPRTGTGGAGGLNSGGMRGAQLAWAAAAALAAGGGALRLLRARAGSRRTQSRPGQ